MDRGTWLTVPPKISLFFKILKSFVGKIAEGFGKMNEEASLCDEPQRETRNQ